MPSKYPLYDLEYYTGSQVSVYIGEVLVDEIESLAFSLRQNKTPVYGYASKLFDAVIPGNVLVQGQFTVNFIDSGYMFAILARAANPDLDPHLQELQKILRGESADTRAEESVQVTSAATPIGAAFATRQGQRLNTGTTITPAAPPIVSVTTTEQDKSRIANAMILGGFVDQAARTDVLLKLAKDQARDMQAEPFRKTGLTSQVSKTSTLAESLEQKIWGGIAGTEEEINTTKGEIFRSDELDDKFGSFDLHITYGFRSTFDSTTQQQISSPAFAFKKITNIHLLGSTQEIDSNTGNPIKETYTFLAREMI